MITRSHKKELTKSTAVYSNCESYRYSLTRSWNNSEKKVLFVMLNPSTATEIQNDPTVERCERRAKTLGYGAFKVCNIFAYRSTDIFNCIFHITCYFMINNGLFNYIINIFIVYFIVLSKFYTNIF